MGRGGLKLGSGPFFSIPSLISSRIPRPDGIRLGIELVSPVMLSIMLGNMPLDAISYVTTSVIAIAINVYYDKKIIKNISC